MHSHLSWSPNEARKLSTIVCVSSVNKCTCWWDQTMAPRSLYLIVFEYASWTGNRVKRTRLGSEEGHATEAITLDEQSASTHSISVPHTIDEI